VLANARALAARLQKHGYDLVGGGTDTPLMLVDLRRKGITGNIAEPVLERAGITCNANPVPADAKELTHMSGLRFGASACTTRGFGNAEFNEIGDMIAEILEAVRTRPGDTGAIEGAMMERVRGMTRRFPIYPD
jgi:glycine hydroxymethyltransferase